ncbi:MAG TPA: 4'-phosphopantetheinyl transferase superfamily protein [Chitinophagales bacterium]|nr:4'-phosphopantetheinyl transferase superfamily protein [Chitinophagales bacterium]HRK27243.1 4'-phosphopantetheinyl transferase superfamily protein [Chitinophagales bacterium]
MTTAHTQIITIGEAIIGLAPIPPNFEPSQIPPHFEPYIAQLTHPKRLHEWVASRLLLEQISGKYITYVSVSAQGKPYFTNGGGFFSISHSANTVAVVWHPHKEVGIDVETLRPQVLKIKHKFLSEREMNMIAPDDVKAHTAFWCAKEALYKLHGFKELQFNKDIILHNVMMSKKQQLPVEYIHASVSKGDFTLNSVVTLLYFSDTVLAVVGINEHENP